MTESFGIMELKVLEQDGLDSVGLADGLDFHLCRHTHILLQHFFTAGRIEDSDRVASKGVHNRRVWPSLRQLAGSISRAEAA